MKTIVSIIATAAMAASMLFVSAPAASADSYSKNAKISAQAKSLKCKGDGVVIRVQAKNNTKKEKVFNLSVATIRTKKGGSVGFKSRTVTKYVPAKSTKTFKVKRKSNREVFVSVLYKGETLSHSRVSQFC